MPDMDDAYVETLLREHLTAELNGQLGRPSAAFFAHLARQGLADKGNGDGVASLPLTPPAGGPGSLLNPLGRPDRFHRFNGWFIGLAGAALAASIAALWAAPAAFRGHVPVLPIRVNQPAPTPLPPEVAVNSAQAADPTATNDLSQSPVMQWVQRRTLDEGTVVLDDPTHAVPARKLRRQELEHTQWYDPARRAQVEMTVPRENIKFVEMDTY
jgi:hypothetical protein